MKQKFIKNIGKIIITIIVMPTFYIVDAQDQNITRQAVLADLAAWRRDMFGKPGELTSPDTKTGYLLFHKKTMFMLVE